MAGKNRPKISKGVKLTAYERDNWTCQYCDRRFDRSQTWTAQSVAPWMYHETLGIIFLELDHVHPLAHGGGNGLANLKSACTPCNKRKSAYLDHSQWAERFDAAIELISRVEPSERNAEKVIELLTGKRFKMREVR